MRIKVVGRMVQRSGGWKWRISTNLPEGFYEVIGGDPVEIAEQGWEELTRRSRGEPTAQILAIRPGLLAVVKKTGELHEG